MQNFTVHSNQKDQFHSSMYKSWNVTRATIRSQDNPAEGLLADLKDTKTISETARNPPTPNTY
jgi:hypothetical protein